VSSCPSVPEPTPRSQALGQHLRNTTTGKSTKAAAQRILSAREAEGIAVSRTPSSTGRRERCEGRESPEQRRASQSQPEPPSPLVLGSSSPTSPPPRPNGLCGRSGRACGGLPSHRVSSCRSTAGGHWCPRVKSRCQDAEDAEAAEGIARRWDTAAYDLLAFEGT
jgi:hypothetical protein